MAGRPPLKNKTTREQTRVPSTYKDSFQLKLEANGIAWSEDLHYLFVEDHGSSSELATGQMISRVDVDGFASRGYKVVSDDPKVTGHKKKVLMAIEKDKYDALYAPRGMDVPEAEILMEAPLSEFYNNLRGVDPERDARRRAESVQLDARTHYLEELEAQATDD